MTSTTPPQVAVNTRTLDTHDHAQVEACPVRICEKKINLSLQEEINTVASENEAYEKSCEVLLVYYWC